MIAIEHAAASRRYDVMRDVIDEMIGATVAGLEPHSLREAVADAVGGGKRVRPMVAMLLCEALGGDHRTAVPAGVALELLHASSLVHDDIMDRSEQRRGRPTIHRRHGIAAAILAGDALVALAFRTIQRLETRSGAAVREEFSSAFLQVCEGQGLDLHLEQYEGAPPDLHRRMVEKKTARLLAAAAAIGAMLATADSRLIRGAAGFGNDLGMAFQAHDDLLDVVGDEQLMGKPAGIDSRNGKKTYLTLAYPPHGAGEEDAGWALTAARQVVTGYTASACAFLDSLPASPAREMLRSLALALAERRS